MFEFPANYLFLTGYTVSENQFYSYGLVATPKDETRITMMRRENTSTFKIRNGLGNNSGVLYPLRRVINNTFQWYEHYPDGQPDRIDGESQCNVRNYIYYYVAF